MAKRDQVKFFGIRTTKKRKRILIAVLIFVALLIIDLFSPYGGGNLRLAREWIKCGHRPYTDGNMFSSGHIRHYEPAADLELGRNYIGKYYCEPIEAERDGLSASSVSWDFPHLEEAGEVDPFTKKPFPSQN